MSFRLTHIHDYHPFIAVDLGMYRVRAAMYNVQEGLLTCTGFSSIRQSRKNFIYGEIADIQGIAQSIEYAILKAWESLDTIPDDIIMSFPSHTFVSDLITTQYTRADSEAFLTMQEVDKMIKRIEKASYERAHIKSRKQFGAMNDDLRLVSSTIVSIQIDGRSVTSPIGFSGGRVRLTVLNIFVPSSEFNIIRSIISRLDKKVISLIPEPLILPKLIEESDTFSESTCIIDIGYGHTTITILYNNEILWIENFPYGTEVLMELIAMENPKYSLLQIENIICTPKEFSAWKNHECLVEFLSYIQDALFGYLQAEHIDIRFTHFFFHGNIFQNNVVFTELSERIEWTFGYSIEKRYLYEAVHPVLAHDQCMVYGLSLMARELLLVKKDPLVRILRYVLYQYE